LDGPTQTTAQQPMVYSKKDITDENIEAEECRESKVYKVKNVLENREGRHSGNHTNRSRGKSSAGDQVV